MVVLVDDRVWSYSPVLPATKGGRKKFASLWKGPYTVVDTPGVVNYKGQLIGGTQTFVVHRNQLKLYQTPPQQVTVQKPKNHSYSDITAVQM